MKKFNIQLIDWETDKTIRYIDTFENYPDAKKALKVYAEELGYILSNTNNSTITKEGKKLKIFRIDN